LVESAQKEAKIEANLNKIEKIWEDQTLEFKQHKETPIIGSLDETLEFVDTNAMELMGMMSQKDVEEFKERVIHWQKTLKVVDTVLGIWMKVQKNWERLESIFLESEDIRAQLPDDTKRFEKVDAEWKDLMNEASEEPSVVAACTFEGRDELLFSFHQEIELCEKSLNDYLEQKKKIFPRFYFVSNQALLDILSNGNNPEKVAEYLADCFDGMRTLRFIDEGKSPMRSSSGLISKEDEEVKFFDKFTCTGAVENYLCDLEAMMRSTLRQFLEVSKGTADNWEVEKKRHDWLEDYCAQIALVTTQIMWTEEVNRCFDDLEGGSETAMKEYLVVVVARIAALIEKVRSDLSMELRVKIITIITIDVHERDVVDAFVLKKIQDVQSFAWQSQLKFYWESNGNDSKK
jgi:dynein heavy chain